MEHRALVPRREGCEDADRGSGSLGKHEHERNTTPDVGGAVLLLSTSAGAAESAHFKKYLETTRGMITSRRLIDTVPVQLSAKNE